MLAEFTLPEGLVLDYVPIYHFPQNFDIPLKCTKLIKLFYGYVKPLDIHAIRYNGLNIALPLKNMPEKYSDFLENTEIIEYTSHKEACSHLLYIVMTSVTRNKELVTQFLKDSRLYDPEFITNDWIEKQIEEYADPRTIHYTLKILLLEGKFDVINNPKYRLDYTLVYSQLVKAAKQLNRVISSEGQLTRGLNRLIKQRKNMTCIVKNRQFGKATRFLGIEGLYPSFFYKRIPSPAEIRQRAKLIG